MSSNDHDDVHYYGDERIASADAPVPKWLRWTYIILPIWGLFVFFLYWNGSSGWLDRGYWHQLQQAANTTFPIENLNQK
jgi:hypothetical protein